MRGPRHSGGVHSLARHESRLSSTQISDVAVEKGDWVANLEKLLVENERSAATQHKAQGMNSAPASLEEQHDVRVAILRKNPGERTQKEVKLLAELVTKSKFLEAIPYTTRLELCRSLKYSSARKGDTIFHQGDVGDAFYIILSGRVNIIVIDPSTTESKVVAIFGQNQNFGQMALEAPGLLRNATATALEDCEFMTLDRADYEYVNKQLRTATMSDKISFLRRVNIFCNLPLSSLQIVGAVLTSRTFPQNSVILRQGDSSEDVYFLRSGSCRMVMEVEFTPEETAELESLHLMREAIDQASVWSPFPTSSPSSAKRQTSSPPPQLTLPGAHLGSVSENLPPVGSPSGRQRGSGDSERGMTSSEDLEWEDDVLIERRVAEGSEAEVGSDVEGVGSREGDTPDGDTSAGSSKRRSEKLARKPSTRAPSRATKRGSNQGSRGASPAPQGPSRATSPASPGSADTIYTSPKILPAPRRLFLELGLVEQDSSFGEIGVLMNTCRQCSVISLTNTEVYVMNKLDFQIRVNRETVKALLANTKKFQTTDEIRAEFLRNIRWSNYKAAVVSEAIAHRAQPGRCTATAPIPSHNFRQPKGQTVRLPPLIDRRVLGPTPDVHHMKGPLIDVTSSTL